MKDTLGKMNSKLYVIITFIPALLFGIVRGLWFGLGAVLNQAGKIWRLGGGWFDGV